MHRLSKRGTNVSMISIVESSTRTFPSNVLLRKVRGTLRTKIWIFANSDLVSSNNHSVFNSIKGRSLIWTPHSACSRNTENSNCHQRPDMNPMKHIPCHHFKMQFPLSCAFVVYVLLLLPTLSNCSSLRRWPIAYKHEERNLWIGTREHSRIAVASEHCWNAHFKHVYSTLRYVLVVLVQ